MAEKSNLPFAKANIRFAPDSMNKSCYVEGKSCCKSWLRRRDQCEVCSQSVLDSQLWRHWLEQTSPQIQNLQVFLLIGFYSMRAMQSALKIFRKDPYFEKINFKLMPINEYQAHLIGNFQRSVFQHQESALIWSFWFELLLRHQRQQFFPLRSPLVFLFNGYLRVTEKKRERERDDAFLLIECSSAFTNCCCVFFSQREEDLS